jgi:pyridoxal/pyridoxine/pyridoxamine kinase
MHQVGFTCNDDELDLLEQIRDSQKLATVDQAAEWLIKKRLRRVAIKLCGRNRALYAVPVNRE